MATRTFTFEEASSLMPEVRRLTEEAYRRVEQIQQAADDGREEAQTAHRQTEQVVEQWARQLMEQGIEVKGLWLVDFDNGSGYYCWKYPEPSLQFYHSYADGFGGRVRIH